MIVNQGSTEFVSRIVHIMKFTLSKFNFETKILTIFNYYS
jgi:hypothetical protein